MNASDLNVPLGVGSVWRLTSKMSVKILWCTRVALGSTFKAFGTPCRCRLIRLARTARYVGKAAYWKTTLQIVSSRVIANG